MEWSSLINSVLALIFVLGLIGLVSFLLRRFGAEKMMFRKVAGAQGRRLSISEVLPLDAKRKAVLLKRDDVEHLIVLGEGEIVVEAGIKSVPKKKAGARN